MSELRFMPVTPEMKLGPVIRKFGFTFRSGVTGMDLNYDIAVVYSWK